MVPQKGKTVRLRHFDLTKWISLIKRTLKKSSYDVLCYFGMELKQRKYTTKVVKIRFCAFTVESLLILVVLYFLVDVPKEAGRKSYFSFLPALPIEVIMIYFALKEH